MSPTSVTNPTQVGSSIKRNSLDNCIIPVNRFSFVDYFPRTKAAYKGFIAMDFRSNMEKIVNEAVISVGELNDRYQEQPLSSKPVSPIFSSLKSRTLDENAKDRAVRDYYLDIKSAMLEGVDKMEWRAMKELNESQKMYEQSNAYLKSAKIDIAIGIATLGFGKAIKKFGKNIHLRSRSISKANGAIKVESTSFKGFVFDRSASFEKKIAFNSYLGWDVFSFKDFGKKGTASLKWDISLLDLNKAFWKQVYDEIQEEVQVQEQEQKYEVFNCFDFVNSPTIDFITDFAPYLSQAKTITNIMGNLAYGNLARRTADRMKEIEDRSNKAERIFNENLKQTISNDVLFLSPEEIKGLVNIFKNN